MFLQLVDTKAPWLWVSEGREKNMWVAFRGHVNFWGQNAVAYVAADTKYYLYVNGNLAVFEGGLNRGPVPGGTYVDPVDLSTYLKEGDNVIAALVWYWGNEGRNNVDSGCPGFYFAMEEGTPLFKAMRHISYGPTEPPWPAYLYGGYNIGYDARRENGRLDRSCL